MLPAGESVANLADVVGTAFGIALARTSLPVVPMFALLSGALAMCGVQHMRTCGGFDERELIYVFKVSVRVSLRLVV